jgi:hypothetical protein
MGPTPLNVTHKLEIRYTILGLTHKLNIHCNAEAGTGGSGFDLISPFGGSEDTDDWLTTFGALFGPCMGTGTTADGYTLFERVENIYVPVHVGTWIIGTVASATVQAHQITLFLRGVLLEPLKIVWLEGNTAGIFKATSLAGMGAGALKNFVTSLVTTTEGALGFIIRDRAGDGIEVMVSIVGTYNRKLRRHRGVA